MGFQTPVISRREFKRLASLALRKPMALRSRPDRIIIDMLGAEQAVFKQYLSPDMHHIITVEVEGGVRPDEVRLV